MPLLPIYEQQSSPRSRVEDWLQRLHPAVGPSDCILTCKVISTGDETCHTGPEAAGPGQSSMEMRRKSRSSSTSSKYLHLLYLNSHERDLYFSSLTGLSTVTGRPESTSFFSMTSSRSSSIRSVGSSVDQPPSTSPSSISSATIPTLKYADDHYPLITAVDPSSIVDIPTHVSKTHSAFYCARQMAGLHNTVIRALNSAYNHATSVRPRTQRCRDFLRFNEILCTMLTRHHEMEDEFLFPEWERLLGRTGVMEENSRAHDSFMSGFHKFQRYITSPATAENFNGPGFRKLIEGFAPELIQHLHDEITTIVNLYVLDSKALLKVWDRAQEMTTQNDDWYTSGPFVLGCQDNSFCVDGKMLNFPRLPWVAGLVTRNWHARRHAAVWDFCPSDLHGQRRLLEA